MRSAITLCAVGLLLSSSQVRGQEPQARNDELRRLRAEIEQVEQEVKALGERLKALKESVAKLEGPPTPSTSRTPLLFPPEIERAMLRDGYQTRPVPLQPHDPAAPQEKRPLPRFPRPK